jgi:hypothetical protein
MFTEAFFDIDAELSALALGWSWQAEQIERVGGLRREVARLEASEVRVLANLLLDAEGTAGEDAIDAGDPEAVTRRHDLAVRSLATELAASTNTSLSSAQVKLGEAWTLVNELFDTLAALESGEISRAHAHELIVETAHLPRGRREAEAALLPWARRLAVAPFKRKAKEVLESLAKDSLKARHDRAFAQRRVTISAERDGMARLEVNLDAADAALIRSGLQNAALDARAAGDARTVPQLEADVVTGLLLDGQITVARTERATTASVRERAVVTVEVLIPAETLAGKNETAATVPGFGVIDPAKARELVALAPSLRRILTDPVSGAILDFDRTSYRVPAELRRVLRWRDGHCRAPGCSAPLANCELDHTGGFARGGTTSLWNLAHLCDNHHHLKHEAGWSLRQSAGGVLEWRSPTDRSYRSYPENPFDGPPGVTEPAPFDASVTESSTS